MAVRLPRTEVVVIGLGGAGGVAVEPLTAAGRNVIALEAGTRLGPKDFAPERRFVSLTTRQSQGERRQLCAQECSVVPPTPFIIGWIAARGSSGACVLARCTGISRFAFCAACGQPR